MKPVFLWTDVLLWLLVAVTGLFVWHVRRHRHLREPWRRVMQRPLGAGAAMVLAVFILIGLLDSVHFRPALPDNGHGSETHYSGEVLSLFDRLVTPLRTGIEKTYSAPFACHLYQKESVRLPDGRLVRDYPRLKHACTRLTNPEAAPADITGRLVRAVLQALAGTVLTALFLALRLARRRGLSIGRALTLILRGGSSWPLRTLLAVFFVLLLWLTASLQLATDYHVLGTDKVGNDVYYQTLKSIRTGLVIGTLTTLVMLPFAIALGIMAGYFKGLVDDAIQYLYTTLNSIPGVLLIAAAVLMLEVYMTNHPDLFETTVERADLRLFFLCLILGVTSWTGLCRLLRGETFKLAEIDYIQAAQAFGVRHAEILRRHILPNVMHVVLITVVLDFSGLVLAEAVLSYVGVGVDPAMNSWGNMINRARLEMARDPMVWWSLAAAFIFMFALVLAANLFSDAVRDAFDPRLRER
ncbi:MAG TPA: ABC transporter permease [Thiotrichales bacterium]|nr:ABC transporter permease [Thiotrichales bacterium]